MEQRQFDYKPLACNKNDRALRWDIKRDKNIPEDALYVKMGDINSEIVRYIVIWGEGVDFEALSKESPATKFHRVSDLMDRILH